jgi:hypothetical protein
MPRRTLHNIRPTVATHLRTDLGVSTDVVALILAHTPPGPRVTRVYNRADLRSERRSALGAWAQWLEATASGEPHKRPKVLPLTRGARKRH